MVLTGTSSVGGGVCKKKKKKEHWLPFSQLNTKRLALLKFSTSASGLGYRKRRGREKARKWHFITFFKVLTQILVVVFLA